MACFGLTLIPAVVVGFWFRPFTQEHIKLLILSSCAGGTLYWTSSNLLTGVFTSRQGNYRRDEDPLRYWLLTAVVGLGALMTIWMLIHQIAEMAAVGRSQP